MSGDVSRSDLAAVAGRVTTLAADCYRSEMVGRRKAAIAAALDLQREVRELVWLFPREEVDEQAIERMGR